MLHKVFVDKSDHVALKAVAKTNGELFRVTQNRAVLELVDVYGDATAEAQANAPDQEFDTLVCQGWYVVPSVWEKFIALRYRTGLATGQLLSIAVQLQKSASAELRHAA